MIRKVRVTNYKSIPDLTVDLGRVTVLIGANGSGKSNILEAIALASAASQNKLDNEFLTSRGIRVTETRFMRSVFSELPCNVPTPEKNQTSYGSISISIRADNKVAFDCELFADEAASYPKWNQKSPINVKEIIEEWKTARAAGRRTAPEIRSQLDRLIDLVQDEFAATFPQFLVYAPENSALRTFQVEGQILPLGIRGEGLFAHLKALDSEKNRARLIKIKEQLTLIDWFESFDIPDDLSPGERSIRIRDRYLPENTLFDQRSANEGFLFLLFYVTLLISPETPAFFSIDNIDSFTES